MLKKIGDFAIVNRYYLGAVVAAVVAVVLLTACSKEVVSHNTLEDARSRSRANALFNLQLYRAENPRFDSEYKIVAHADETIDEKCPQGDGWAQLSLMKAIDAKNVDKWVIMCSTVSSSLGCYVDKDFAKKPFAGDEGHCQPTSKVPFPLPALAK